MSLLANKLADHIFKNLTDVSNLKDVILDFVKVDKIEQVANAVQFWYKGFLYHVYYTLDNKIIIKKNYNSTTFGRVTEFTKTYNKE